MEDKYKLILIEADDIEVINLLYKWNKEESNHQLYTCRPIKNYESIDEYKKVIKDMMFRGIEIYILKNTQDEILGKITLFDLNTRNRSAEFGYYLPLNNRGKGYGRIMSNLFINERFSDTELNLNKLYATTASGNIGSIKILNKLNFRLDGVIREHYWLKSEIQDQHHYSLLRKEWED